MIKLLPQTRNKGLDAPREVTQNWKMVIGLPTRYTPFLPVIRRGSLCSGSAKGMIHWSAIPKKVVRKLIRDGMLVSVWLK